MSEQLWCDRCACCVVLGVVGVVAGLLGIRTGDTIFDGDFLLLFVYYCNFLRPRDCSGVTKRTKQI